MTLKHDTCPYCKTALGYNALSNIKKSQQIWGYIGLSLGLIGAGLGVYYGAIV